MSDTTDGEGMPTERAWLEGGPTARLAALADRHNPSASLAFDHDCGDHEQAVDGCPLCAKAAA